LHAHPTQRRHRKVPEESRDHAWPPISANSGGHRRTYGYGPGSKQTQQHNWYKTAFPYHPPLTPDIAHPSNVLFSRVPLGKHTASVKGKVHSTMLHEKPAALKASWRVATLPISRREVSQSTRGFPCTPHHPPPRPPHERIPDGTFKTFKGAAPHTGSRKLQKNSTAPLPSPLPYPAAPDRSAAHPTCIRCGTRAEDRLAVYEQWAWDV
jgi:hypothetical protein